MRIQKAIANTQMSRSGWSSPQSSRWTSDGRHHSQIDGIAIQNMLNVSVSMWMHSIKEDSDVHGMHMMWIEKNKSSVKNYDKIHRVMRAVLAPRIKYILALACIYAHFEYLITSMHEMSLMATLALLSSFFCAASISEIFHKMQHQWQQTAQSAPSIMTTILFKGA